MSERGDVSNAGGASAGIEFNVGVDLEEVARFSGTDRAIDVLFTEGERVACADLADPAPRLTGTWCAKEATVKALWPWVRLDPRRVEVVREPDGRPTVLVSGWDMIGSGISIRVSISHTGSVASAVAVVWGPSPTQQSPSAQGVNR